LFQGYTIHGAQFVIEYGQVREHQPGEVLCREGDEASFVCLILSGTIQVYVERKGRKLVLLDAGPGTIVGEIAVLCGIRRSASLGATDKVVALHWSSQSFRRLLLNDVSLSERILRHSLRTLIEKEQSLIASLEQSGSTL
jgi:CRP-like cAMP-binding protein